jgi:hypothetical protein
MRDEAVLVLVAAVGVRIRNRIELLVRRQIRLEQLGQRRRRLVLFLELCVGGLGIHGGRLGIRDLVLIG